MTPIIPPLVIGEQKPEVGNLQEGLLRLIDRRVIVLNDQERVFFEEGLRREREELRYSDVTARAVEYFTNQYQQRFHLAVQGQMVDQPTADALNALLREQGLLDEQEPVANDGDRIVRGRVMGRGGPLDGVRVGVFDRDLGALREELGWNTTHDGGRFEVRYTPAQFAHEEATRNGRTNADLIFQLEYPQQPIEQFQIVRLPDGGVLDEAEVVADPRVGIPARDVEDILILLDGENAPRGLSEYERLLALLQPVMGEHPLYEVEEEHYRDVSFLVQETGADREDIELLLRADALSRDDFRQDIPPQVFYGLGRLLGVSDVKGLARFNASQLRDALVRASGVEANIIPALDPDRLDYAVGLIVDRSVGETLDTPAAEGRAPLRQVLELAQIAPEQQQTLVQSFARYDGTVQNFWQELRATPGFEDEGTIKRTQLTLQLGALTQNNLSLMGAMQGRAQSTRELARLSPAELQDMVNTAAGDLPGDYPGDTPEEKHEIYSNSVVSVLQAAFPTETVAHLTAQLPQERLGGVAPEHLQQFLLRATDEQIVPSQELFDIRRTHVDTFMAQYGERVLEGIEGADKPKLSEQLKRAQRLFQVSTTPMTFKTLMGSGFNSASEIAALSPQSFEQALAGAAGGMNIMAADGIGAGVDPEDAKLMHARATTSSAASLHVALQAYQAATDVNPMVLGGSAPRQLPEWAQLFGRVEMCECEHCRSIYSAAAYLVDVLQFLGGLEKNAQGETPLDVLVLGPEARRPDLAHLKLSCENTNTALPYIDLVNEILESYVAYQKLDERAAKDTGDSTSRELMANPQFVEDAAYQTLRQAVYPIGLPFDRNLESIRVYLDQLGTSRRVLLETFGRNERESAAEALGLTEKEYEIIAGSNFNGDAASDPVNRLFGFEDAELNPTLSPGDENRAVVLLQAKLNSDGANPPLALSGVFGAATANAVAAFQLAQGLPQDGIVDADDWAVLAGIKPDATGALTVGVPEFLARTGLSYVELIALLKTRFINPSQTALAVLDDADITYKEIRELIADNFANATPELQAKLDAANLTLPDVQARVQELLRTIVLYSDSPECDLDQTYVQYLGGESLDDADVLKVHRFIRLWRHSGWTMQELDTVLGALGCANDIGADCLIKIGEFKQAQTTLDLTPAQAAAMWGNLETHGDKPLYATLFQNKAVTNPPVPDFALNATRDELQDASHKLQDKTALLTAALQLRPSDLDGIVKDAGLANGDATLADLSALYRYAVLARALELPVVHLIALKALAGDTRNPFTPADPAPTLEFIEFVNAVNQSGFTVPELDYVYRHHIAPPAQFPAPSITIDALIKGVQDAVTAAQRENAQRAADPNPEELGNQLARVLPPPIVARIIALVSGISTESDPDKQKLVQDHLTFIDNAQAQTLLLPALPNDQAAREAELDKRIRFVLTGLGEYLVRVAVRQAVSSALGLDASTTQALLENVNLLHANADANQPIMIDLIGADQAALKASAEKLYKVSLIITRFGLSNDELEYWHGGGADQFDLNALPLEPQDAPVLLDEWETLARYAELRKTFKPRAQSLIDVLSKTPAADQPAALAALAGWSEAELKAARDALGIAEADLKQPANLYKVVELVRLARRAGVSVEMLRGWATQPPDAGQATAVKNALKAEYNPEAWLEVSRPLSDTLRAAQRDALVKFVLTMPQIKPYAQTSNQLFEYFLIDVEMDPCMATSRIKQAISSVQLFVQRCLLNLELGVSPRAIDANRWEVIKLYRVWEADRKVFVTPENWTLPEWLHDKSPFFKELESDLMSSDLTEEAAERALLNYLYKLDEVAQLEICGTYLQDDFEPNDQFTSLLHVIGRTRGGAPRTYFYRQLVNNRTWSPWERVSLDIQGVQGSDEATGSGVNVLPVVWNRRLYLFWLQLLKKVEKPDAGKNVDPNKSIPIKTGTEYWEIRLGWSRYDHGKWTAKQVSGAGYAYPPLAGFLDKVGVTNKVDAAAVILGASKGSGAVSSVQQVIGIESAKYTNIMAVADSAPMGFPQPYMFRLRAAHTGDGLELQVSHGARHLICKFVVSDSHGELEAWAASGTAPGTSANDPYGNYYQGGSGSGKYDFFAAESAEIRVPVLGWTPRFTVIPLNQYYPSPRRAPYMYQNDSHTYFVRARESFSETVKRVERPENASPVAPGVIGKWKASDVVKSLARPSPVADKVMLGPWAAAEQQLASTKLSATAKQVGMVTSASAAFLPEESPYAQLFLKDAVRLSPILAFDYITVRVQEAQLQFQTFFHPFVRELIKAANQNGVAGLMALANQTRGNAYLSSPWQRGQVVAGLVTDAACVIEGGFGKDAPKARPGNFEAVVLQGNSLVHYAHDNSDTRKPWSRGQEITPQATGAGCIAERLSTRVTDASGRVTRCGDFEVVVPEGGNLNHYRRDMSAANTPFTLIDTVTGAASGPGCIVETRWGNTFALDVVVPEGSQLAHYRFEGGAWVLKGIVTDKATGAGGLIQSSIEQNGAGQLQVAVREGSLLVHYEYDASKNAWTRAGVITEHAASAGWLTQSRIRDGKHGNYEVVVCESDGKGGKNPRKQLVHYWRDNSEPGSMWRRGQVITTEASGAGCLVHGSFGAIGNFEVVVPEGGQLVHYWHTNEGGRGSAGERFYFWQSYTPTKFVDDPYPRHDMDFSFGGAYSQYNWELFFYAPLLITDRLMRNLRFDEAFKMIHYLFKPTDDSNELSTHRFWKFLPLRDVEKQRIDQMLAVLADPAKKDSPAYLKLKEQLDEWAAHPFDAHRIARLRLIAYQKYVVMKYMDILREAGDVYFRRDTIESINEATQYYVLWANMLGQVPQEIPTRGKLKAQTYAELRKAGIGDFGMVKQQIENEFPFSSAGDGAGELSAVLGVGDTLYFCIPQNDKLLLYWDTVADRLFKIRHCMNIEGVVRQLPLFEPPIDPALLVAAAAQGVDIASAVSDLFAPLPLYRFPVVLQKAMEVCGDIKNMGATLLGLWEKLNGEDMALTKAEQELRMLRDYVSKLKDTQIREAEANATALEHSFNEAALEYTHFGTLLGQQVAAPQIQALQGVNEVGASQIAQVEGAAGVKLIPQEGEFFDKMQKSLDELESALGTDLISNILHLIPNFDASVKPLGVGAAVHFGGQFLGMASGMFGLIHRTDATRATTRAQSASTVAQHIRKDQDMRLSYNRAIRRMTQLQKQHAALQVRVALVRQEKANHEQAIADSEQLLTMMKDKVTNKELYGWMVAEAARLYYRLFDEGVKWARRAVRCAEFELGIQSANQIQLDYWDHAHQGFLAGERLHLTLRMLEREYHEQNKREHEITKHVSLALLDPIALINLKKNGRCEVELPEALFDLDFPGHYLRRIKSVAVTIPSVVGPYASINCRVRLLNSEVRFSPRVGATGYARKPDDDRRFRSDPVPVQSIAVSGAQNDSGLFETNLNDSRYLPFEGAGAISRWQIELPEEFRAWDYDTMSDCILTLRLTAREDGALGKAAVDELKKKVNELMTLGDDRAGFYRLFSLRHEFATEWYRFTHPGAGATATTIQINLNRERFPLLFRGRELKLKRLEFFASPQDDAPNDLELGLAPSFTPLGGANPQETPLDPITLKPHGTIKNTLYALVERDIPIKKEHQGITLKLATTGNELPPSLKNVEDIWLVCRYEVIIT